MLRLKQNYILMKFENSKSFYKIHITLCISSHIVIQCVRRWHPNNWMYHSTCWSYESLLFRFFKFARHTVAHIKYSPNYYSFSHVHPILAYCLLFVYLNWTSNILGSFDFHFEVIFVQYRLIITDRNMMKSLNVKIISNRPANTISP